MAKVTCMPINRTRRSITWLALLLAALMPLGTLQAQQRQLLNYEEIHKPVVGSGGMVVSQNTLASQVGAKVLADGGNAVDAAVATAFALAVTLPRAGNIGGDGFMLLHLAEEGRSVAIDFRSMAPAAATLDAYIGADGAITGQQQGYRAAGVPGTVAGLALAHRKYGKLPWRRLVEPARKLAADGIVLTRDEAFALQWGKDRLARSQAGARVFLHADGNALRTGERLVQRDLAWSLGQIARHGEDAFYRGEIARRLEAGMQRHGGLLTRADLAAYRAIEREPLRTRYRGVEVVAMPLASAGGVGVVQMLQMLESFDLAAMGSRSADALHVIAEVQKLAWRDRERYAGDPGFTTPPLAQWLSPDYARRRAALVDPRQARAADVVQPGELAPESPQTTQFSVVDAQGNAVSTTYTLGSDFGSGVMIEGTGFLLGNLIGNFSLQRQLRDRQQGQATTANGLQPGKRPVSSMSPTLLLRDGKPWLVTGSPGGNTIPGTVVQQIVDVVDFRLGLAESTSAPRIHQDLASGKLQYERALSPDTLALLRARGHQLEVSETIGSTQSILLRDGLLEGAPDPRRPGAAAIATGP